MDNGKKNIYIQKVIRVPSSRLSVIVHIQKEIALLRVKISQNKKKLNFMEEKWLPGDYGAQMIYHGLLYPMSCNLGIVLLALTGHGVEVPQC